ncbi:MAG: helix-turn-helix transcriptional regulator [bacterium]|nr:helix-turn-helix transcriptional regulator [bacterium]
MILIEERPKNPTLTKYVDRYQLFIIKEPAFLKTIPNGMIECYFVKEGEFIKWDAESELTKSSGPLGFLPASNQPSLYHIPDNLICLNIKLNLKILSFSLFSGFLTEWKSFEANSLIPEVEQKIVLSGISDEAPEIDVNKIDSLIEQTLSKHAIDHQIEKVLELIEERLTGKFKVGDLAEGLNMSNKSFERWIRKEFNLTPKELWQVTRFQQVSYDLKHKPNRKFIDSLAYGYYDQSHFIKECRKITGYSPRELFSKMKLPTNDIIFE